MPTVTHTEISAFTRHRIAAIRETVNPKDRAAAIEEVLVLEERAHRQLDLQKRQQLLSRNRTKLEELFHGHEST